MWFIVPYKILYRFINPFAEIFRYSEMREFRSLSSRLFKENSPKNSSVFLHSLERYFFETKDENSTQIRDKNENSLPEE